MASPSPLQLDANRANALLSTGPRTADGKQASSRNALSHGLTSARALLPGENQDEYDTHHQRYVRYYRPVDDTHERMVAELADLEWRLRRVPALEARLLTLEQRNLKNEPELRPLIEPLESDDEILTLAFRRLIENRVLPNLYNLEARLCRRAEKIKKELEDIAHALQPSAIHWPKPMAQQIPDLQNEPISTAPFVRPPEPGRNQPCNCGSGRKYKHCCWGKPIQQAS